MVYLGFAVATSTWQIWLLFAGYGIYYGIIEGVARAFIADLVPEEKRGTAYGLYHGVVGITLLHSNKIIAMLFIGLGLGYNVRPLMQKAFIKKKGK